MTVIASEGKKPLITVIDDMIGNLKVVGKILLGEGFEVVMTQDSKKAIEVLETNPPDLILLDIMMPYINGYEVCEQIKMNDKLKDIPVIFLTAKNDSTDLVKAFDVGAVDYIVKPANKEELLVRVKTHLELRNTRDLFIEQENTIEVLSNYKNRVSEFLDNNLKKSLDNIIENAQIVKLMKSQLSDNETEEILNLIIQSADNSIQTISKFAEDK
jgi:two-component system sensor histidine kinase/response regulator